MGPGGNPIFPPEAINDGKGQSLPPFFIVDKNKRQYEVVCHFHKPLLFYDVYDGDVMVGTLECSFNDSATLRLYEITIYDDTRRPRKKRRNLWRLVKYMCSGRWGKKQNHRNQGLGTALLQLMIEQAKSCGFEKVVGTVFPQGAQNDKLMPWFKKMGFNVMPPDRSKNPMSIAEIELKLNQVSSDLDGTSC